MATVLLSKWTNTFSSDELPIGRLNSALGWTLVASSAYQKWPTWNTHSSKSSVKKLSVLTNLKFENRWKLLQLPNL